MEVGCNMGVQKGTVVGAPFERSQCTILVIDDDDDLRDFFIGLLKLMGFRSFLEAKNGMEGIEVYVEHIDEIRLIILDLEMPVMDGAAFFREFLRINQGRQRKAKVLLATGKFDCPVVKRLLEEGLDMAIPKPTDLEIIRKDIRELLGSR